MGDSMNICRICLKKNANKSIFQLELDIKENKTYFDIMSFCLGIEISENLKISTNLCLKCFKKIISFHKFKELALKNDEYLKTQCTSPLTITNKIYLTDQDIKKEDELSEHDFNDNIENEETFKIEFKAEDTLQDFQSDDELLSVIKKVKYDNFMEDTKENEPIQLSSDKREHNNKQICEECGVSVKNIKDHMQIHQPKAERKRLKCKECDKLFSSYNARYKHFRIKHMGYKQHCDICNKDVVALSAHRRLIHEPRTLKHICLDCGRRFLSQSALDLHVRVHTSARPFECQQCDKKFRSNVTMVQHVRQVHDKEKSHLCQYCSKSFFKKYHLQIHLRKHTKEKPYECNECGKHFSSTSILKNHQLIHGNIRKYECTFCDMTFVRLGYLQKHLISHTKEKRHPCKYCGLKFGRSDHRKRHEFTAHEKHMTSGIVTTSS